MSHKFAKKRAAQKNLILSILSLSIALFLSINLVLFTSITRSSRVQVISEQPAQINIQSEGEKNPECIGFEVLDNDNNLLSNTHSSVQIAVNVNQDVPFYVSAVAMDPDASLVGRPMSICWTIAGQSPDFYKMGAEAYVCHVGESVLGPLEKSGTIRNTSETFTEYVQQLLDAPQITDTNKAIIREQVNQNGLVFVYNFYDDSRNLLCSSNVAWNVGAGVTISNGNINTDANKCATLVSGKICKAHIRVNPTSIQTQSVCNADSSVCNNFEVCDTTVIPNRCSTSTMKMCNTTIIPASKSQKCIDFDIQNHQCTLKDLPDGTVCGAGKICISGLCQLSPNTTPTPVATPTPITATNMPTPATTPVPIAATNYSAIKTLNINIRLGNRPFQNGYIYPINFVGVWREAGENSRFLTYQIAVLANNTSLNDTTLLAENGNTYTLDPNDYLIIKPEGYLSKAYKLKDINIPQNVITLDDPNPFLAGDSVMGKGTFDIINIRDKAFFKTFFGKNSQYDYYYMDYNGDGNVNILDGGLMNNNEGESGASKDLNPLIIPAIESVMEAKIYKVISKN
jgi:hypothetical protein